MVMPEHVPAFAKKKFIGRANIDPRTFVVLGDSEAALSVIDSLRMNYTGKIVLIPTSPFGAFENLDILNKKFSKISRNEVFLVEEDYLDRANVNVITGAVKAIDFNKNKINI